MLDGKAEDENLKSWFLDPLGCLVVAPLEPAPDDPTTPDEPTPTPAVGDKGCRMEDDGESKLAIEDAFDEMLGNG